MKKLILLLSLSVILFADVLAQDQSTIGSTPPEIKSKSKKTKETHDAKCLRIRNNVLRPLGKDWYLTVSAGYGIPFLSTNKRSPLKEIGDKDWYQHYGDLSVKPIFGTNGGGFAMNIGWGHMFNKYIGIDVLHTIAWHPEKLDARIDIVQKVLGSDASYYATEKTGTFAIYIAPHLIFRWDNGKRFGITGKAGIVLPIFGKTQSRAYILDKQGRVLETLTGQPILPIPFVTTELIAKATTAYNPTVGLSASIGFDVKLNKRCTFFMESRVQAYTIKLRETTFTEFQLHASLNLLGLNIPIGNGALPIPTQIDNVDQAPEFLIHYVYRDEITLESNTARYGKPLDEIDMDKPMDEPGQKFNASTLYINAGIRIDFDLWNKQREQKREQKLSKKHKI